MSRKDFKEFYLEHILSFLWRQWSALGAAGGARSDDPWAVDPEALLLFSIKVSRYEPRLFDEILSWLIANGKWIDLQKLRGIARRKDADTQLLLSAIASFLTQEARSFKRKWEALKDLRKPDLNRKEETLFISKEGKPFPRPGKPSEVFRAYGFIREEVKLRNLSRPAPVTQPYAIRFMLRALFGLGSRAECILYLLTHEAGHPAEIAREVGISVRAIQDALIELAQSELVLTRSGGKRKIEYRLPQERWCEFLAGRSVSETKPPLWLNWIDLFSGLSEVWDTLKRLEGIESDYLRSSRLRECMEAIGGELSRSGLALPSIPGRDIPPERYEEAFMEFIAEVLGAQRGTDRQSKSS